MIHEVLPVGMLQCNCSILGDPETREAIVVDPGDEADRILERLARHGLKVRAILSTHAHIDHVGGLKKLHDATGAPVLMHSDDIDLYRHLDEQAAWLGARPPDPVKVERFVNEGDSLRWGRYQADVIHTPGHTRGSISLFVPQIVAAGGETGPRGATNEDAVAAEIAGPATLLAGDTLFAGSIGRTDLWGGSLEDILRSIHQKLLVLPEDTRVYPGHGGTTTIGEERHSNPFLNLRGRTIR